MSALPPFTTFNRSVFSDYQKAVQKLQESSKKDDNPLQSSSGSDGPGPKNPGFDFYKQRVFLERASKASVILGLTVPRLAANGYCDTIRAARLPYRSLAQITLARFPIQFMVKAGQVWSSQASSDVISSWSPETKKMNQVVTLAVPGWLCQTLLYNDVIRSVEQKVQERNGTFLKRTRDVMNWGSVKNNLRRSYAGGVASMFRECGALGAGTAFIAPYLKSQYESFGLDERISKPMAGITAGAITATLTQPLHVVSWLKSQAFLQAQAISKKTGQKMVTQSYSQIIKKMEAKQMFSGLSSRIKIIPLLVGALFINDVNQPIPER